MDVNPGDRQATCQGAMEPVSVELKNGGYSILHRCVSCGFERRNKVSDGDNFDTVIKIASRPSRP